MGHCCGCEETLLLIKLAGSKPPQSLLYVQLLLQARERGLGQIGSPSIHVGAQPVQECSSPSVPVEQGALCARGGISLSGLRLLGLALQQ